MSVSNESEVAVRGAGLAIARLARQLEHGLESGRPVPCPVPHPRASPGRFDRIVVARRPPDGQSAEHHGRRRRSRRAWARRPVCGHGRSKADPPRPDGCRLRTLDDAEAQVNERLRAIAAFFEGVDPDAAVSTLREWHTSLDGYRQARREAKTKAAGSMTAAAPDQIGAFGADVSSPYVPIGVARALSRSARQHPARSQRLVAAPMLPIALAHKSIFALSLVASFLGLVVQVLIPNELRQAIDEGLVPGGDLLPFVSGDRRPRLHALRPELHLAALHAQGRLPDRVRPPEHHLRAPEPHVVPVLRPGAVRPADLARPTRTSARCRCTWRSRRPSWCSAASRCSRSR